MSKERIINLKNQIEQYLNEANINNIKLIQQADKIIEIADIIKNSNQIFICGNGGSSATASHFSNDLQKMCGLKAYCLTDNIPLLTAYTNDSSYDYVFEYQLQNLASKNDTLIVISGSGNSENIYQACVEALWHDMNIIAFVGMNGGKLMKNFTKGINYVHVETDMLHSEDWHLTLCHLIVRLIKEDK